MMVMQLWWLPAVGKKILGGERWSGGGIFAAVDASVIGAAQLGWTMARHEPDKPHKVFFDTYL
jgi:hypothetical protein